MHQPLHDAYPAPLSAAEADQTHETFNQAFDNARNAFYGLSDEPGFQALCANRGIDPIEDTHRPKYWAAFSDFAHRSVTAQREAVNRGDMYEVPDRELTMQELVASVPDAVYTQLYLDGHKNAPWHKIEGAVRAASHFNGLVRQAAQHYPDATPSQMTNKLLQIANIGVEHPAAKKQAGNILRQTVRGAQFELLHGQVMEAAGLDYSDTDVSQDVIGGADYTVRRGDGTIVPVNVKSSQGPIRQLGGTSYAYDRRGVLFVSMVNDEQAGDSFRLDPRDATRLAPLMGAAVESEPANQLHYSSGR